MNPIPTASTATAFDTPNPSRSAAFVSGLFSPSIEVFVLAVLVCLGWFGVCARHITPKWIALNGATLASDTDDEFPKLAAKTTSLRIWPPRIPTVIFIGDSSLREAVASERELTDDLTKYAGRDTRAKLLAAGGISLLDQVAVTDQLIGHVRSPVVLEVSEFSFGMSPTLTDHVFPFRSPVLNEERARLGVSVPMQTHNLFLDCYPFFAARVDQVVRSPWKTFNIRQHLFERHPAWSEEEWRGPDVRAKVCEWESGYHAFSEINYGICERMLARLRAAGLRPCLLRMTENPRDNTIGNQADANLRHQFGEDLRRFAATVHVPLIDGMEQAAGLQPTDFFDYVHVCNPAARHSYTDCLARRTIDAFGSVPTPPPEGRYKKGAAQ